MPDSHRDRRWARYASALLFLLISQVAFTESAPVWVGARVHGGLATGSGSGYWDWTTPGQTGRFRPGYAVGAGTEVRLGLQPALELSAGALFTTATVSQTVNGSTIAYTEGSVSFPFLAHTSVPAGAGRVGVLLGPAVTLLPFPTTRTVDGPSSSPSPSLSSEPTEAYAGAPVQASMEAGVEWSVPVSSRHRTVIGLRFVHPLTSPGYRWLADSEGNTRINRFDFTASFLRRIGVPPPAAEAPEGLRPEVIPSRIRVGIEVHAGTAIGTGKSHWDWYGGGPVQRMPLPAGSIGVKAVYPFGDHLSVGGGVRYAVNPTRLSTSSTVADYRHDSVEGSLAVELLVPWRYRFRREGDRRNLVVWGGPALVILPGSASVHPVDAYDLREATPDRPFNIGADLGLGVDYRTHRLQFRYVTLYTAPEYPRTDGDDASDLRWHRFEIGVTWFLSGISRRHR
ncbi:MAG: hypothetical protein ACLFR8_10940 [Alkalispirochaeta sp.]